MRGLRAITHCGAVVATACFWNAAALAQSPDPATPPTYSRVATMAVPGKPLTSFDISYVDRRLPLYYLADRDNAALDIFETVHNRFLTRVGGFVGTRTATPSGPVPTPPGGTVTTAVSGPNGVVPVGVGEVWVGDGDATVKVVDLFTQSVVATISTARPGHDANTDKRADEMAYDPVDHILVVANNAAVPPFVTFISTRPEDRQVLGQIVFDQYAGVEQAVWNPSTGRFYINLTALNSDPETGGVAVVNPKTLQVTKIFPVTGCEPAGLAVGPRQELLVGCAATANSQIINALDGTVEATITQVAGSDEVWFNRGDKRYYLAARNNPAANGGPVLGVIDARTDTFLAAVPTDVSAHSVAADARTNLVYVPLGPIPTDPDCATGCIGIYGASDRSRESQLAAK